MEASADAIVPDTTSPARAIRVLMLSTDRTIFIPGSQARNRMIEYGTIFDQLHIVVFSLERHQVRYEQLSSNVWVYPTNSWSRLDYGWDAIRLIKKELTVQGDLISDMVTAQDPFETGLVGWHIARTYRRKLQLQVHTDFSDPYFDKALRFNRLRRLIARFLLPRAQCVRVVSSRMCTYLEQRYPGLKGRIDLLPIFVDLDRLSNQEPTFNLHEKYPHFTFIVLMLSRLTPEKNVAFAIEVFAPIARKYPSVGMVIVTHGGPEKNRILARAATLGISSQVVIEPWTNDVVSYYKTANLFLHTSKYEGYGMVLLEAAACGIPIVTSDVGIASSLPKATQHFFVCPVGDISCFTEKIHMFLTDPERRMFFKLNVEEELEGVAFKSVAEYLVAYRRSALKCFAIPEDPS